MKVRHILFVLALVVAQLGFGAIPPGYYKRAEGLKKADLKAALHDIIGTANTLNYGSGAGSTWYGFYQTDRLPDGQVRDRYSYQKHYFDGTSYSAPSGMNVEHSMANSWWGGAKNQAYKDIHHLMPCESKINSTKSNYPMGLVTNNKSGNGCTKVGTGPGASGNINLWEPADEWKGDFARVYFYMATCYSNLQWTSHALGQLEQNAWPTLQRWTYELLLQWNANDPVDDIEIERNDKVYSIQGNRNPFIDHPELADYIWGSKMNVAWYADNNDVPEDPVVPDPIDPTDPVEPEDPEIPSSEKADGSFANPYSISDVKNHGAGKAWVWGYIIGSASSATKLFVEGKDVDTNIAIAEDADDTSFIPVKLSGDMRDDLGIRSNPGNRGRLVKIYGTIGSYFGVTGISTVVNYWLRGEFYDEQGEGVPTAVDANFVAPVDAEQAVFTIGGVYLGSEVPTQSGTYIVRSSRHAYIIRIR